MRSFGKWHRVAAVGAILAVSLPLWAGPSAPGQKKNKKDKDNQQTQSVDPRAPQTESQVIDQRISEMLAYWQIGDVDSMHKYYADDVATISGAYEPPLLGWDNYLRAYQAQRARTQGGRMDRINTFTKVTGDTAWSTYQW